MKTFNGEKKEASLWTAKKNREVYEKLDFTNRDEFSLAQRNRIAAPEVLEIQDGSGKVVWSQKAFAFLDEMEDGAGDTVNPSFWRNASLNHQYGLFEVVDGIYQVRGYDMSNFTVIRGRDGWIVCDPLISCECAAAALRLVNEYLGERPVSAVLISHPHIDHFGGIKGIVKEEDVISGKVPVIVPEHFTYHAVSENVYAMNAMQRRAGYQYGTCLDPGTKGTLSMGIGMGQSRGLVSFIRPTMEICKTGERHVIDGVTFIFQMTPETEAPAEMTWYLPEFKALWMAELCNATMHNLYTLRGTQIRDGNAWAWYIAEAKAMFGEDTEVVFQSHNWPHWGNRESNEYLENTAAVYKFINDQTLMYLNMGYTPNEISHMLRMPKELEQVWYTRPYYGTASHNARGVYQRYLGWYDGNPVNLNPLPPVEDAKKTVAYMGGAEAALAKAAEDFEKGEYQWVAKVTNALVFADPENWQARYLCADAMEQMGYQAECGPWRNCYLTAAAELRNGPTDDPRRRATNSGDIAACMDVAMMLEYLGIMIDGEKSQQKDLRLNLSVLDTGEEFYVHLYRGALLYYPGLAKGHVDAELKMEKRGLAAIVAGKRELWKLLIQIKGREDVLEDLMEHAVRFDKEFAIVEP